MPNWERRLLLAALWPLLLMQSRHVRRVTPRMPEALGKRTGISGHGSVVRVLVAGDSGAAGVGVSTQDQALGGQLVRRLAEHHTVEWCVVAANGLDSPGLIELLEAAPPERFDIVVLSMGANDLTRLCAPQRWLAWQNQLATLIRQRFEPALLVHSAVPPMHACAALPQPLRWFLGRWAREMNRLLSNRMSGQLTRSMHWHPAITTSSGLAVDGMHPSSSGYALWAESLSAHILSVHRV